MKRTQEKWKNEKGITLIALVVTIVVLLILAGITINMLFSNGGIFKTAQDAANAWNEAVINEQASLDNIADQIENLVNGQVEGGSGTEEPEEPWTPPTTIEEAIEQDEIFEETKQIKDNYDNTVTVPKGFKVTEDATTVPEGIVIEDANENQFVWIPVDETSFNTMYTEVETPVALTGGTGVTTRIYSKLRYNTESKPNTEGFREPDLIASYDANQSYQIIVGANSIRDLAQKMVDEYIEIHDSIEQYGGFYIGRYELTGNTTTPTLQKGQVVLTNQNWYNLKAACMKIVDNTGKQESEMSAKTTMIYGNQWDEVCNWLANSGYDVQNSTIWGNYSDNTEEGAGEKQVTGYSEKWKANNIYDFAGNCWEWTQEAYSTGHRIVRGGIYNLSGSDDPVSKRRNALSYTDSGAMTTTRPILYIMTKEKI